MGEKGSIMKEDNQVLPFNCPQCGGHRLEEVMVNVTVASRIVGVTVDMNQSNSDAGIRYGDQTNDEGEVDHYQCQSCGHILQDEEQNWICSSTELGEWLKEHQIVCDEQGKALLRDAAGLLNTLDEAHHPGDAGPYEGWHDEDAMKLHGRIMRYLGDEG